MFKTKKRITKNILFLIVFISTIANSLTIAELLTPTDKVMKESYVSDLRANNLNNRDSVLLRCSGFEASSFVVPEYSEESDTTVFTEGALDWSKISRKFGKEVDFIVSVDDKGIAIINGLYSLEDPNANFTDNMRYKNFLIFLDMGVSEFYPWKEFSTVQKRMKYGRQFSGSINRYTGDISIYLDGIRSESKDEYVLKAACNQVKKLF